MKILVFQIGSLGDTIVSVPSYRAIRRAFGAEARIAVLHDAAPARRPTPFDVLAASGLVDAHIGYAQPITLRGPRGVRALMQTVRRQAADVVVSLAPAERSRAATVRDRLFFRLAGIPRQIGFHAYPAALFRTRDAAGRLRTVPNEAVLRLERLRRDGIASDPARDLASPMLPLPAGRQREIENWLHRRGSMEGRPRVALCPGANQPANRWPIDRFAEIGRRLLAERECEIVVVGGPAEQELGRRLVTQWGGGIDATGEFDVVGSAWLLRSCRFMIGVDTGTTHLAAACGVRCVALYGGRNPVGQWEPLGQGHTVLRGPVECAGCRHRTCPRPHHPCMAALDVETVWRAVDRCVGAMVRSEPTGLVALGDRL